MGQGQRKRRAVLIVEDDAELRHLTAALFEDEKLDTIECESAEAALAILLIGGREVAMIFADVRLPGAMGGVDLAWEVKLRWPLLPMILTSGHPLEHIRELPPGVAYMPKPWQPLNVLIAAEQALASGARQLISAIAPRTGQAGGFESHRRLRCPIEIRSHCRWQPADRDDPCADYRGGTAGARKALLTPRRRCLGHNRVGAAGSFKVCPKAPLLRCAPRHL